MGATTWQSTSLCGHLKAPSSRAACLRKRVLRSGYWWKIWPNSPRLVWEKIGERHHSALWKTGCRWASLLPLICWQGLEDGNKGVSAEIPEPIAATPRRADSTTSDLSCHSKESWLDHFGLINKFLLPLKSCHHQQNNNARWPTTSEDQWTRNHAGPMVVTISLAFYKDFLLLLSISFLFPVFPISLSK